MLRNWLYFFENIRLLNWILIIFALHKTYNYGWNSTGNLPYHGRRPLHYSGPHKRQIHCHPEYEINVVINTKGTRVVGDSEEEFSGLDFVMTGPYIPHVWKAPDKPNHVVTIQFSDELLNFQILNKRLFMPIKQLLLD